MPDLKFDEWGLITAVIQHVITREVLMVAWMNEKALKQTIETGQTHFWSRSRQELWHKGGTSGNVQNVCEIRYDCDGDTLLILVEPAGPACHTGEMSCFYRRLKIDSRGEAAGKGVVRDKGSHFPTTSPLNFGGR